jgi:hypothetical protein
MMRLVTDEVKAHSREAEDLWLLRMLDLASDSSVEIVDVVQSGVYFRQNGHPRKWFVNLGVLRLMAVRVAYRNRTSNHPAREGYTEHMVILGPDGTLLCQCKDDLHPNRLFRGKLGLFGGGACLGESRLETIVREMYEEVRDPRVVDSIIRTSQMSAVIERTHDERQRRMGVWAARARTDEEFKRWQESLSGSDVMAEASFVEVPGSDLDRILMEQVRGNAKHFADEQHLLVLAALSGM